MWSFANNVGKQNSVDRLGQYKSKVALAIASLVATGCVACTIPIEPKPTATSTTATTTTKPKETTMPEPAQVAIQKDLESAVAAVAQRTGAVVSAAVSLDGGTVNASTGPEQVPVAWSTSKVPLAIAAAGADPATMQAAIENSDNDAADALWEYLGGGEQAAAAVRALIGVPVPAQPTREGFSSFGQTKWSLEEQASFAAELPCVANAGPVLQAMQKTSQRFGFAEHPDTATKAGWGPRPDGRYEVRQMALVDSSSGPVGVAIHVIAADGTFEGATAAATEVARELTDAFGYRPATITCE